MWNTWLRVYDLQARRGTSPRECDASFCGRRRVQLRERPRDEDRWRM